MITTVQFTYPSLITVCGCVDVVRAPKIYFLSKFSIYISRGIIIVLILDTTSLVLVIVSPRQKF